MDILRVILALSVLNICVFMKCITDLSKRIDELEKKIDNMQHQVLCDLGIVNRNVKNNYGLLGSIKDEIKNDLNDLNN